jgi:CBS domain-containing protein
LLQIVREIAMLVEEVMTRDVITIDSSDTVFDACKTYSEVKVGSLVVMDRDIIVGIITERDIIERAILQKKDPSKTKIREIMSQNIKTVHALAPIDKAIQIMNDNKIKKLPVILNNDIVGIITETDLTKTLKFYSEALEELTELYKESREDIEKILEKWGNIIYNMKGLKKSVEPRQIPIIKR